MKYEEYNGWTNWDTWNAYNWLTEDEGIYKSAARTTGPMELRELFGEYISGQDGIDLDEVNWDEVYEGLND
jgi:hypothetical protein